MASWEVLLPLFGLVLVDGGTPLLFWGFIVQACGMLLVYASLAEMASMSPTAGGQYHWVSEVSGDPAQETRWVMEVLTASSLRRRVCKSC